MSIDFNQKGNRTGTNYLALIKDAATRIAVGYATGRIQNSEFVVRSLSMVNFNLRQSRSILSDTESVFTSGYS